MTTMREHYGDPFGEQRALVAGRTDVPIGRWAREAVRIAAGELGPDDVTGPGEQLVFLHLDGSDNVLPQPGDLVFSAHDVEHPIGRVTSAANHYELGPIGFAALREYQPIAIVMAQENGEPLAIAAHVEGLPL